MAASSSSAQDEWANEDELSNFFTARSLINLIDISSLPLEKKKSVQKVRAELSSVAEQGGKLERTASIRYTGMVKDIFENMKEDELKLESKMSVETLKHILDSNFNSSSFIFSKISFTMPV